MVAARKACMKDNRPIILYHISLSLFTLLVLFLPLGRGMFFGSEGDWYVQHVAAADAIRQTMLESGSLFPQFIELGAGANIYDFAYYGLLRPDVVFSCLVPSVDMKYIIAVYAVLGVLASVNLCFYWLRKQTGFAFLGAVLLATATCFFHAHHQIMFINYMPFLILAFMGIDRLLQKGKSLLLIAALFLIYIHSFFYSPSCLVVCGIYFLYKWRLISPKWQGAILKGIMAVAVSIGMAAVLLVPMALDILSTEKDAGVFSSEPIQVVDLTLSGLLFNPYGCGFTFIALICLLASLKSKPRRILAMVILLAMALPIVSLTLNGFLYARAKILIPFAPLIAMICALTLHEFYERKVKLWPMAVELRKGLFALVLIVPLCASIIVNKTETYLPADDNRQSLFTADEIVRNDSNLYRFDILTSGYVNSNVLPRGNIGRTSMYSSISNKLYADFCYEVMKNPISSRNRVALVANKNPLFNYYMGIKYVLCHRNNVPYGYEVISSKGDYVLAMNENVLPKCYGIPNPHLITPLQNPARPLPQALWQDTGAAETFLMCRSSEGYPIKLDRAQSFHFPLARDLRGKVLIISFGVDDPKGDGVVITIDGMKNCLSSKYAPYPNNNNDFTYVLPIDGDAEALNVYVSKGNYRISGLQVNIMDAGALDAGDVTVPEVGNEFEHGRTELFGGSAVFGGSITMDADGYFVTSYPYKKGFEVLVDGERVSPEKVNTAFLGFPLSAGEHEIEINYMAPGFGVGLGLSLFSLAWLVLIGINEKPHRGLGRRSREG